MRIYISASMEDEERVIQIANYLKAMGHTITREWWNFKDSNLKHEYAYHDLTAIQDCDFFIFYNSEIKTTGKYVEFGIALGLNKPIISLGKELTTVFRVFSKHYKKI